MANSVMMRCFTTTSWYDLLEWLGLVCWLVAPFNWVRSVEDCDWVESKLASVGEPVALTDSEPERGMPREKEPDERTIPENEPDRGIPLTRPLAFAEEASLPSVGWGEEGGGGWSRCCTGDCDC